MTEDSSRWKNTSIWWFCLDAHYEQHKNRFENMVPIEVKQKNTPKSISNVYKVCEDLFLLIPVGGHMQFFMINQTWKLIEPQGSAPLDR
jgi:hypothetical protein